MRALGNITREVSISDFKKSNSEISINTETIDDLGLVNVFTMSYFEGSINIIVTQRGDFIVGGEAYLDILVIDDEEIGVPNCTVELTINETTESSTTSDDGSCSFLVDTEIPDTYEFQILAISDDKTGNYEGEYTIVGL